MSYEHKCTIENSFFYNTIYKNFNLIMTYESIYSVEEFVPTRKSLTQRYKFYPCVCS